MEKGILACNEGKELFMRVWPIVSSWRKEQFMRKCAMAKEQYLRKWWSIWVDAEPHHWWILLMRSPESQLYI